MDPDETKAISEEYLRELNIQVNPELPTIESMDELSPQEAPSVAQRAIVLCYMIGLGYGKIGEQIKDPLAKFGLLDFASVNELRMLNASTLTDQDKINCSWLSECVQSLGYCLGLVELNPLRACDMDLATHFPKLSTDPTEFIRSSKLRPFSEIYQEADLHYRLHWAARNSRLMGEDCTIQDGFISERRRPLDWVIGVEADWDAIQLDT